MNHTFVGWLVGWLVCWLFGCLGGLLMDWFVFLSSLVMLYQLVKLPAFLGSPVHVPLSQNDFLSQQLVTPELGNLVLIITESLHLGPLTLG